MLLSADMPGTGIVTVRAWPMTGVPGVPGVMGVRGVFGGMAPDALLTTTIVPGGSSETVGNMCC